MTDRLPHVRMQISRGASAGGACRASAEMAMPERFPFCEIAFLNPWFESPARQFRVFVR